MHRATAYGRGPEIHGSLYRNAVFSDFGTERLDISSGAGGRISGKSTPRSAQLCVFAMDGSRNEYPPTKVKEVIAMGKEAKLIAIVAVVAYAMIYLYNNNTLPGTTS
jgi:hypothetical protein